MFNFLSILFYKLQSMRVKPNSLKQIRTYLPIYEYVEQQNDGSLFNC